MTQRLRPGRHRAAARLGCVLMAAAAGHVAAPPALAQHDAHAPGTGIRAGAHAIALATHAAPAMHGRSRTEAYLSQPMLMAHGWLGGGRVAFDGMLNLEGLTLRRGELNAGVWGEGHIDRRHPHTYLHEAMVTVHGARRGVGMSLAAGRGFVPFGTDDPMARPFVKHPANHHLAQILERWLAIAAASLGRLVLEGALLNGDEPTGPADLGRLHRFGDSWAARATLLPAPGFELQASRALLASPELTAGGGLDQRKWSASARWAGALADGMAGYALAEWAHTTETDAGRPAYHFRSVLAEAAAQRGPARLALRLERTTRPEEERGFDPFRAPPQHLGPLLGITEWSIASAHAAWRGRLGGGRVEPFAEVARLHVRETTGSIFMPEELYGAARHWQASFGVRVGAGMAHQRVGRYGAARP
jgi:hypothetical protein